MHTSGDEPHEHMFKALSILKACLFNQLAPPEDGAVDLLLNVLKMTTREHSRFLWLFYGLAARLTIAPPVEETRRVLTIVLQEDRQPSAGHPRTRLEAAHNGGALQYGDDDVGLLSSLEDASEQPLGDAGAQYMHRSSRSYHLLHLATAVVATYAHDAQALDTLFPLLQQAVKHGETAQLHPKLFNELRCAHAIIQARTGKELVTADVQQSLQLDPYSENNVDSHKHLFCSQLDQLGQLVEAARALVGESAVHTEVADGLMPVDALVKRPDGQQVAVLYIPETGYEAINEPGKLLRGCAGACRLLDALGIPVVVVHAQDWKGLDPQQRLGFLQRAIEAA